MFNRSTAKMKKPLIEAHNEQLGKQLEARLAAVEQRLERIDPRPKIETRQPFRVGDEVFSIVDLEGRNPLRIVGYDENDRVLVLVPGEDWPRALPIQAVRPLSECPRADPARALSTIADPAAREFFDGRRRAETEAKTKPFTAPVPQQQRYSW
jgi:hypothetical protein